MRCCEESPPEQLLHAVAQFNSREWFECHETLEELWRGEQGEIRRFYQGVIQIAVSLHHWNNGNFGGAVSLLKKGMALLSCVAGICQQVDVAGLIADSRDTLNALESLGHGRMRELKKEHFPLVRLVLKPGYDDLCKPGKFREDRLPISSDDVRRGTRLYPGIGGDSWVPEK